MMRMVSRALSLAVVVGSLLWAAVVGPQGPARVAASRLAGMQSAGVSGYQVQNLSGEGAATIEAQLYRLQRGGAAGQGMAGAIGSPNVPVGRAANGFLPQSRGIEAGIYSGLVWADRPVGAIVRTDWFASGGAALYSDVGLGPEVALPLAMVDYAGGSSVVFVQNARPEESQDVSIELRASGESAPAVELEIEIAGGHSVMLDLARDERFAGVVPNTEIGFLGSMTFRADGPIGVQSYIDFAGSDRAVVAFEGVPTDRAATTLYAPLIRKQFFGYDTGISVVNPGDVDGQVTVRYIGADVAFNRCAGLEVEHGPTTVPAGSSTVFYQGPGGASGLPDGCVGSAVIDASVPVLAIVNDSLNFTESSAAHNAVRAEDGSTRVALPLVRRQHVAAWKLTTGIQVMNVSERLANVTLTIAGDQGRDLTGCGGACSATIAPRASHMFYPGAGGLNVLPRGAYGSAVLSSDEPIVVLVNDASEVGALDAASYVAIKADVGEEARNVCDPGRVGMACLALPSLFNGVDHREP